MNLGQLIRAIVGKLEGKWEPRLVIYCDCILGIFYSLGVPALFEAAQFPEV